MMKKLLFGHGIIVCGTLSFAGFSAAFSGDGIQNLAVAIVFLLLTILLIRKWPRRKPKTAAKIQTIAEHPIQGAPVELEIPIAEIYTRSVDTEEENVTAKDAPFSYLDARALIFWNQKNTGCEIPSYYGDSAFGRNALPALKRLLDGGYLDFAPLEKSIALKKVPDLKAILAERELKTSGKKAELIQRLMDNIPEDDLMEMFPNRVYEITPKGSEALEYYSIVFANIEHNLGLSYYRLLRAKDLNPTSSDEDILLRLLLQDLDKAQKNGKKEDYCSIAGKTANFLNSIGQPDKAFEWYCIVFFLSWYQSSVELGLAPYVGTYSYHAKAIDASGKLCGYSLKETLSHFRKYVQQTNPFGLGTKRNVDLALKKFKEDLSI